MALSEIEKLERRYAENPSGLTFAPLAEVHRKNGDVARALELLRPGLELHPNYVPASIVLGRCHLDLGDLPAAEQAFSHVLALDGENVIALKALADISERQHHFDQAERWLGTLLSVDRSNDDARAQLARVEQARRDVAATAPAAPAPGVVPAEDAEAAAPEHAAAAPSASAQQTPEVSDPAEPSPAWSSAEAPETSEAVPLTLEDLEPATAVEGAPEPPPEGLQIEEPQRLEAPVEPLAGLVGRDVHEPGADESAFRVELSEDIVLSSAGGHEFQMPDAALELSDREPAPPVSPFGGEQAPGFGSREEEASIAPPPPPVPPESEPVASAGEPTREPTAEPMPATASEPWQPPEAAPVDAPPAPAAEHVGEPVPDAAAVPDVVAVPEPELVVTESMAEVLLQQGHPLEALRVYRELEARSADDPRLRQKIAELERETAPAPEPALAAAPEPELEAALPPRRVFTAAETGGQSVGDFFRDLLAARLPTPPAARAPMPPAESSGAPTRPAADALSLSSVFGEETTPLPPAVPAAGTPGGVSFDEFYGAPTSGAAAQKARSPDPKNDDLDQFHAWLQNLKR